MPRMTKDVSLRLKRRAEKATMRLMSTSICPHDGGAALIARGVHISDISDGILYHCDLEVRLVLTFPAKE